MKYLFLIGSILFGMGLQGHLNPHERKKLELKIHPILDGNSVSFEYEFLNQSDKVKTFTKASFGNYQYYVIELFNENNILINLKCSRARLRYGEIFNNSKNYFQVQPSGNYRDNLHIPGCKASIEEYIPPFALHLDKGKYKVVLTYVYERKEFIEGVKEKLYQDLWEGEVISDTSYFELKSTFKETD